MKFKAIFRSWKVWFLIVCLFLSVLAISPNFNTEGVSLNSIDDGSIASMAGMKNPNSKEGITSRERILEIDSKKIKNLQDYTSAVKSIPKGTFRVKTDKAEYVLLNNASNELGITVSEVPSSNLRKGLDLQGGTRVMLKPEQKATEQEIKDVIDVMHSRLNVYGLSDLSIKPVSDLEGNNYVLVEIAGATPEEVRELVAKQGVFEAKIAEDVVFEGGKRDITFVCRESGTCSGISKCGQTPDKNYGCRFEFQISLSPDAAKKHAEITKDLEINRTQSGSQILSKTLDFYLDGKLVDQLSISAELKGKEAKDILITGPGVGETQDEAIQDAINNQNKLQTILITGSLPTKMEIVKLDTVSPNLGEEFLNNAILVGALAVLAVMAVILIRYRKIKIMIPIGINLVSELIIVLGLAALFRYNLDLAAIAGIIASIGTGVDDVVIISDEVINGEKEGGNLKQRIKRAFFVILSAYALTVVAMLPLLKVGAGLLVGFALVTIAGVSVGVFITRPAFSAMVKALMEE